MPRSVDDFAPKIPSGIDAIDREWGGLYDGGVYLVYGRVSNGRGLLALLFSQIGAALDEKTLYVSSERSKDLIIQAASIGFDIRRAHRLGIFKLVRSQQLLGSDGVADKERYAPFDRLISHVRSYAPKRLVVSDPAIFAGSLDPASTQFRDAFMRFLELIEPLGTTLLISLPEPATEVSRRFTEFIMSLSTAAVYVGRPDDDSEDGYQLTLIPQIGHITRKRTLRWNLDELVDRAERVGDTYRAIRGRLEGLRTSFMLPTGPMATARPEPVATPARPERRAEPRYEDAAAEEHVVPPQTLDDIAEADLNDANAPSMIDRVLEDVLGSHSHRSDLPDISSLVIEEVVRPVSVATELSDREEFTATLQRYFDRAAAGTSDFLIVAMRFEQDSLNPREFELLSDGVSRALRTRDALYADPESGRLVLVMPEASADQAQELFANVKLRLRSEGHTGADTLLQKVSAIVVPNGNPFSSAAEFLSYVLDGN